MRTPKTILRGLFGTAGVAVLAFAVGCDVQWCEDETRFRYDPGADVFELLVIYKGVTVSKDGPEVLERAVELSRKFLSGRRRFAIFGGSMSFDLDQMVEDLSSAASGVDEEEKRRALEALSSWKLVGSGAFLDESGRLSGWQLFRVEKFSDMVRSLNYFFSRAVRESIRKGEWMRDSPILDERDRELWGKRAEGGKPWLWFDGAELVIDLPITRASYERLQRRALDDAEGAKPGDPADKTKTEEEAGFAFFIRQALAHLRRFEVGEDRVVLRFGAPDGRFRIRSIDFSNAYDAKLLEALKKQGIAPDEKVGIDAVRGKL